MNIIAEIETGAGASFLFDTEALVQDVCTAVLAAEGFTHDAEVQIVITGDAEIRELNREHRGIDKETDVLSFPNLSFDEGGGQDGYDYEAVIRAQYHDCMNPDTGRVMLGDVVVNADAVKRQAKAFDHSEKREFAFLVAHSMLHLIGYDHMLSDEATSMEEKQEAVLRSLGITRDITDGGV